MLAAVPLNAALCRLVRGYSVGANAATPDLWGFCGARQPAPRLTSHPACPGDGGKANPGHSAAMKGATQMVTSDRNSHPDPKPALEHADRMLRETGPETAGLWPRTAARLIRLAPERAADLHWSRTRPEMTDCPATMRTLIPEGVLGRYTGRGPRPRPRPESLPCLVPSFRRDSPAPIRASARSRRTATLAQRGHLARGPARSIRRPFN